MGENEKYLLERGRALLEEVTHSQESQEIDKTFLKTDSGQKVFQIFSQILKRSRIQNDFDMSKNTL